MQEACLRKRAGVAYACPAFNRFAMMSLLVVLPNEFADPAPLPEPLQQALASAGAVVSERATCHTLVQQVGALAPQQVLAWLPAPAHQLQSLLDALKEWNGAPPCAFGLVSAPLDGAQHESLVALGVHAWAPLDAFNAASLAGLTARAQARWQREAALRTELEGLRTRMDERKWVDRAKGLLMSARGIGEDEAFGLLRGAAMHANLRLGEVSRSVMELSLIHI